MSIQITIDNPGYGELEYGGTQVSTADPGAGKWFNNAGETRLDISQITRTGLSLRAILAQFENGATVYIRTSGLDRIYSVQGMTDHTDWFELTVTLESSATGFSLTTADIHSMLLQLPKGVGGGGVTDHGALTGLSNDTHGQYLNNARGDVRYYTQAEVTSLLSGKSDTSHDHAGTYLDEAAHDALPSDNPHGVDAADVGLGSVDNTADSAKPVSTAQQTALDLKQDLSEKSAAGGYASLDGGAKVPVGELPTAALEGGTGDAFAASHPAAGHTNTPTAQQKAALAGTNGTPDTGNEYVTDSDSRLSDSRNPTSHTHEGTEVLSTAEGAGKVLTSTAGGASSWEAAGAPGAHDLGGASQTSGVEAEFRIVESDGAGGVRWADNAGGIDTVFGRTGPDILAVQDDYTATLVDNDSTVSGTNVKAALEQLDTDITDHGALTGNPHETTLQGAIADAATPDNDVNVPSSAPVVLRDNSVAALVPVTVAKTNNLTGPTTPAIRVEHAATTGGIDVTQPASSAATRVTPGGLRFNGETATAGYEVLPESPTTSRAGKDLTVGAGRASTAGVHAGGDLILQAGKGSDAGTPGSVLVGTDAVETTAVELGVATVPTNVNDDLDVAGDITVGGTVDGVDVLAAKNLLDDHADRHHQGGNDELAAQDLSSLSAIADQFMTTDGAGGWQLVAESSIDHDGLANFDADEHIDWSVTGAEQVHADRYSSGTGGATNTVAGTAPLENAGDNTNADIAFVDQAQDTIIGRVAVGSGPPTALTATQARQVLNVEDNAAADQTADEIEALVSHNNLNDYLAAEHTDWSSDQSGSPTIHVGNVAAATTTTAGLVELATNGEVASSVVVQGNDDRLSDDRNPTSHNQDFTTIGAVPEDRILGRDAAGTGFAEALDATAVLGIIGVEAGADVTVTANVRGAGALMDDELTSLTGVKSLTVPDSTTITPFGKDLVGDATASDARTTLSAASTSHQASHIAGGSDELTTVDNLSGRLADSQFVTLQEDAVGTDQAHTLNFGTNMNVSVAAGVATVTSDSGSAGHVIEQNTTPLTARAALNFGNGLLASDNSDTDATDVVFGGALAEINANITDGDLALFDFGSGFDSGAGQTPGPAAIENRFYWDDTNNDMYRDNGSAWEAWTATEINDLASDGINGIADNQLAVGTGADTAEYQTLTTGAVKFDTGTGAFTQAASSDLSDIATKTGTGTEVVMSGSPTLTTPDIGTPTIASFASAGHDHSDAANGGTIAYADITGTPAPKPESIYIETPVSGDVFNIGRADRTQTISAVHAVLDDGTSVVVSFDSGASRATSDQQHVNAQTCSSTTTGTDLTKTANLTFDSGDWRWFTIGTVTGSTGMTITVSYT